MPVVGFLEVDRPSNDEPSAAFRQGLNEAGLVEGENIKIEYRWAENKADQLQAMAAELVRLRPAVIVTTGGPSAALAAKATTDDTRRISGRSRPDPARSCK